MAGFPAPKQQTIEDGSSFLVVTHRDAGGNVEKRQRVGEAAFEA